MIQTIGTILLIAFVIFLIIMMGLTIYIVFKTIKKM